MKKNFFKEFAMVLAAALALSSFAACENGKETKLLFMGHSSFRVTAKNGTVIYIDPYAEGAKDGYSPPADIILITHEHSDHCKTDLVTQKKNCVIITNHEAIADGKHKTFKTKGIKIEAVEANNRNHNPRISAGYIITVDGIKLYHAGDTSRTRQMESFPEKKLDYAMLPVDGTYNMSAEAAAECAGLIKAKHNIPMHTGLFRGSHALPSEIFNRDVAERFAAPGRIILEPGDEIILTQ